MLFGLERITKLVDYIEGHTNPFENHGSHLNFILISFCILLFIFVFLYKKKSLVPTGLTNLLETFVIFIRDEISIAQLGKKDGEKWASFFCVLFFFILVMNLLGLFPHGYTATGSIFIPIALALIILFIMTIVTIFKNGLKGWFSSFIPSGVPIPILFILLPIEIGGLIIKPAALCIRLCANMFAGHVVLFSILGGFYVLAEWIVAPFIAIPLLGPIALGIYILEIFVAFLQAYIFTYLSAIFIGQMFHPDH